MRAWIIQGNPDRFDIDRYLGAGSERRWTVPQAKASEMNVGDKVFFWRAAGHPPGFVGVIAVGELLRGVEAEEEDPAASGMWREPPAATVLPRVRILVKEVRSTPAVGMIEKSKLIIHPVLKDLQVIKMPRGTVWPVPVKQMQALEDLWNGTAPRFFSSPEESSQGEPLTEGAVTRISVNAYERNPAARAECLKIHGVRCVVCGFDFDAFYGNIAKGFIHVHHLKLISDAEGQRAVDPKLDLRPVCPNCHAVLHMQNPPFSIEELRALIHKPLR